MPAADLFTHRLQAENAELRRRLQQIQEQARELSAQCAEVERHNADLANLYVAGLRLHSTVRRDEVLLALREVIANLLGCEQQAVWWRDGEGPALSLVDSWNVDVPRRVEPGEGLLGRALQAGSMLLPGASDRAMALPRDRRLTAAVPLKVDGETWGLLALYELLPQKLGLDASDYELLDLISAQAGIALLCASLFAREALA
jgi:GAF domain-containing protein